MINLLKVELLKLKNSSVLTIVLAMLFVSIITSVHLIIGMDLKVEAEEILNISMNMFGLVYYPIFIILFVAMIIRLENINNIWKVSLVSKVNKNKIYLSKYIFILIISSLGVLIYILSIILISAIKFNMPEILFIGIRRGIYIILSSLGFISIEFVVSLIFKSFLIPISLGIMGIFITFITTMAGKYIILNPFGYVTNIAMGIMSEEYILISVILSILISIISMYIVKIVSQTESFNI